MVATGSIWLVAARIAQSLIAIAGMAVLARILSPQEFGVLAISHAQVLLLSAITIGFIDFPAVREDDLSDEGLKTLIWGCLALVGAFAVITWFGAPLAQRLLDFPHLADIMRARIPATFIFVIATAGMAVLRRAHRFRAISVLSLVNISTYIVLTVIMALAGLGMWSLVLGHLAAISTIAFLVVRMGNIRLAPPRRFDLQSLGRPALMGALSRAIIWAWSNIDTVAVGFIAGPAITGLYNRAYNINHHLKEPFAVLDSTLRQALAILKTRTTGYADQVDQALRIIMIGAAFVAAAVISARVEIVLLLLGQEWRPASGILYYLAMGLPARAVLVFLDGLSASVASLGATVLRNLVLLGLVIVGVIVAAPFGAKAIAGAVSGALYVGVFLPLGPTARGTTLPRMVKAMAPGVLIGVGLVVAGAVVRDMMPTSSVWRGVGLASFFAAAFAGLALLLPDSWLGSALAGLRKTVLRRLGLRAVRT
jgi:O-antigen/teichoic acid export membrane protein